MPKRLVLLAVLALAPLGSAHAQTRRISADDLTRLVRIADPQISPDGKTIALIIGRANLKDDRWDTELSLIDIASKQLRVMTHDRLGVGSPRWSANGESIAYLAQDAAHKNQLFVLPLHGGDSMQLTHGKTAVSLFAWKPDGSSLAFAATDEEPEKKDEAKFEDGFEVGNNDYLQRAAVLPTHLWMVPATGGEALRLTSGTWSLPNHFAPAGPPSQIAFTPDGRSLLFVKAAGPISGDSNFSTLELLDLTSGKMRAITPETQHEGHPSLSPDGTQIAYSFPREGKPHNEEAVYLAPLAGGPGKDVAFALDRDIGSANWMPDGKTLLLSANEGTSSALWMQPLSGPAKRIDLGSLNPAGVNVGRDGAIAFAATDATHPAELFYIAHPGEQPVQLTHLQTATDGLTLGRQETLHWISDKFTVNGVLTYPPDFVPGRKYPLVLYIHGGPTAVSLQTFTPTSQIFAAQGWLVFEPNYRGSNGQGNAFSASIVRDAGAGPGRDVMAGVEALKKRGIVEDAKIAVSGWSYGGYMTAWLIGNYPNVWRAAVAGAPVTDIVDQYTLSDNNAQRAASYGPSPFVGDNLRTYQLQSPLSYAWRVKAPTLILSDVGDWRVTTTQAYKLFHALQDNHVPVKFIAFPVPGHSPADPIRSRDVFRRWTAWLNTYLNTPEPTTTAAGE